MFGVLKLPSLVCQYTANTFPKYSRASEIKFDASAPCDEYVST